MHVPFRLYPVCSAVTRIYVCSVPGCCAKTYMYCANMYCHKALYRECKGGLMRCRVSGEMVMTLQEYLQRRTDGLGVPILNFKRFALQLLQVQLCPCCRHSHRPRPLLTEQAIIFKPPSPTPNQYLHTTITNSNHCHCHHDKRQHAIPQSQHLPSSLLPPLPSPVTSLRLLHQQLLPSWL